MPGAALPADSELVIGDALDLADGSGDCMAEAHGGVEAPSIEVRELDADRTQCLDVVEIQQFPQPRAEQGRMSARSWRWVHGAGIGRKVALRESHLIVMTDPRSIIPAPLYPVVHSAARLQSPALPGPALCRMLRQCR